MKQTIFWFVCNVTGAIVNVLIDSPVLATGNAFLAGHFSLHLRLIGLTESGLGR